MSNYKQKLSKKEKEQLALEQESYQQIINEMTPINNELQASINDILPDIVEKKSMIDFQQIEIEAAKLATDFIDAQLNLYVKDPNKRNEIYLVAKRQNDIFTLTNFYEQMWENKMISKMMFEELNNAEKKHPRLFEVLSKHQQVRSETIITKVKLENDMILSWHNVVALHDTIQQANEISEIAEGVIVEDDVNKSIIGTHQDMIKEFKENKN